MALGDTSGFYPGAWVLDAPRKHPTTYLRSERPDRRLRRALGAIATDAIARFRQRAEREYPTESKMLSAFGGTWLRRRCARLLTDVEVTGFSVEHERRARAEELWRQMEEVADRTHVVTTSLSGDKAGNLETACDSAARTAVTFEFSARMLGHSEATKNTVQAVFKTVARPASWSRVGSTPMHLRQSTLNRQLSSIVRNTFLATWALEPSASHEALIRIRRHHWRDDAGPDVGR